MQEYDADHWVKEAIVAEITGLAIRTVQRKRYDGTGPRFTRLSRRAVRYRLRDVYDWLESRTVGSTCEPAPGDGSGSPPRKAPENDCRLATGE
jgi:predicted DNA-binding transcriptional regulator AlpA